MEGEGTHGIVGCASVVFDTGVVHDQGGCEDFADALTRRWEGGMSINR